MFNSLPLHPCFWQLPLAGMRTHRPALELVIVSLRQCCLCLVLAGLVLTTACTKKLIPNTDVEDRGDNRKIVQFCEEYRRAVERRNIALLLELSHPQYHEDGGNIDGADDIDRQGLKKYLESQFKDTKAIRYEIKYRRIGKGRKDVVFVDYTYSASYKLPGGEKGDIWRRVVADNRLELVPSGDSYKIKSGM